MAAQVSRADLIPGATIIGRNGRRREVIDLERDEDGHELVIYRMVKSPRKGGERYGLGYVSACQVQQMLRWAHKLQKEDP